MHTFATGQWVLYHERPYRVKGVSLTSDGALLTLKGQGDTFTAHEREVSALQSGAHLMPVYECLVSLRTQLTSDQPVPVGDGQVVKLAQDITRVASLAQLPAGERSMLKRVGQLLDVIGQTFRAKDANLTVLRAQALPAVDKAIRHVASAQGRLSVGFLGKGLPEQQSSAFYWKELWQDALLFRKLLSSAQGFGVDDVRAIVGHLNHYLDSIRRFAPAQADQAPLPEIERLLREMNDEQGVTAPYLSKLQEIIMLLGSEQKDQTKVLERARRKAAKARKARTVGQVAGDLQSLLSVNTQLLDEMLRAQKIDTQSVGKAIWHLKGILKYKDWDSAFSQLLSGNKAPSNALRAAIHQLERAQKETNLKRFLSALSEAKKMNNQYSAMLGKLGQVALPAINRRDLDALHQIWQKDLPSLIRKVKSQRDRRVSRDAAWYQIAQREFPPVERGILGFQKVLKGNRYYDAALRGLAQAREYLTGMGWEEFLDSLEYTHDVLDGLWS